jgi:hypothetical protein
VLLVTFGIGLPIGERFRPTSRSDDSRRQLFICL